MKEGVRRGLGACWKRSAPLALTTRMSLPRSPVEILKETERAGVASRPKRPRVLVLAPTRELAEQITGVAKHLSHFAKYRASCLTGGECGCLGYVERCVCVFWRVCCTRRFRSWCLVTPYHLSTPPLSPTPNLHRRQGL